MNRIITFFTAILLPFIAGGIGSVFTSSSIPTWYAGLEKPFFSPPNWIFGPVWTALYFLIGLSLYLVWISKAKKEVKKKALQFYFIQLVLNTLWSIIFFGFRQPQAAFLEIIALWVTIYVTIHYFSKISSLAGKLLIPYIVWVSFASILNLAIVLLN